ncbi:MAG: DeoR/GlpR family DNA-binding transcription regulator, partial [Gammaproteobacteria bacterium]
PVGTGNLDYGSRQILSRSAKQAIAREVARHVPDNASVAFGVGTTPEVVAAALLQHEGLRVVTNNLNVAMLACSHPGFEVNVAGGRVRNGDGDILGSGMEAFWSSYMCDIGVYGVAGVSESGGLLDFYDEEVRVRRLIHENSRETFLVVDQSKFTRTAHVRGGEIGEASKVFCDGIPPPPILEVLERSGSELVICAKDDNV